MAEGKAFIVAGVEEELDPMLDPVLNKQWIQKGKQVHQPHGQALRVPGDLCAVLITRLPNPHFSPEDQAKCVVVDFTGDSQGSGGAVARSGHPEGTKELGGAVVFRAERRGYEYQGVVEVR